ncbi:hypothetical protein DSO57_1011968 [Entomophthora muscae]|uniref:Uncharacterized protein n=1 Tax=Entomophthora muscae TaxID=34485 RepID=A0ACC2SV99_9FUNG|nr:hypothetical protein DSO57_1011968 [Entomophthora muscae]
MVDTRPAKSPNLPEFLPRRNSGRCRICRLDYEQISLYNRGTHFYPGPKEAVNLHLYGAWAPDNLPDDLPPEETDPQLGGVLKPQAQPASKALTKRVHDPQSNYLVT